MVVPQLPYAVLQNIIQMRLEDAHRLLADAVGSHPYSKQVVNLAKVSQEFWDMTAMVVLQQLEWDEHELGDAERAYLDTHEWYNNSAVHQYRDRMAIKHCLICRHRINALEFHTQVNTELSRIKRSIARPVEDRLLAEREEQQRLEGEKREAEGRARLQAEKAARAAARKGRRMARQSAWRVRRALSRRQRAARMEQHAAAMEAAERLIDEGAAEEEMMKFAAGLDFMPSWCFEF
ncbi:MAG: hypothetical protein Q9162_004855 [Coniocarpon cinnabarinum]